MSFFDVLLGAITINDDDYDDDEYNEDDDLDEEDEEEEFEDEKPKKLFNMKFRRKSDSEDYDEEDGGEEDSDEEDSEDEEEKPKRSFFFFRKKKASREPDDEDEEDDEEDEEEEEPPRASRRRQNRTRSAGRAGESFAKQQHTSRENASYRSAQNDYTSSGAAFTGTSHNSEAADWSSVLREKPVKNSRNNQKKRNTGSRARVEVIRPRSMEETQDIAETLMNNSTVILNLEVTDVETSQRIIDFSCGVCYALNGGLKQVANYFYILTPENVEISGDYTNMLNGDFDFPPLRSQY